MSLPVRAAMRVLRAGSVPDLGIQHLTVGATDLIDAIRASLLRKVEAKGRYESARRMRSVLSRVFRYGIATARCDRDVAADLRGALATRPISAVLGQIS